MPWTSSDLAELEAAIKRGALRVDYAGPPARSVMYQSLAEMRSLRAEMLKEINGTAAFRDTTYSKGFR